MVREDWIKNDETFTNPLEDECEEDFEDRFQEVTKENVFKVKDDTPANPYDRDGEFLRVGTGDVTNPDTCVFKLSKEAVSNVWWPLKATKKGSGKLTTALLVFMNSTLGIVHMLGERLETRGLWLEFKKGQLTELPLPDFRKINKKIMLQLFRENHLNEAISAPLPNIREYMAMMSGLEAEKGNYESAINEALKDQKTKHRAVLDKISIQMLKMLGCHTIPNRLYELVFEEIESLRRIMEAANRSSGTVRDRGSDVIKEINDKHQRKLKEYLSE